MNSKPPRLKLGQAGEQQAAAYLKRSGYQILEQNFRYKQFEIDLIALDRKLNELVFIEVKTRSTNEYGEPESAVDKGKLSRLVKAAQVYLNRYDWDKTFRFDIISVLPGKIKHFKNITIEL
jgi:putative endonuclease